MPETKTTTEASRDPWKTPRETWQFVTIPEEDPTGLGFPTIRLNKSEFKAGESYSLPKEVAAFVNERVKAYNRSVTRLFSPVADRKSLNEVAVGTTSPMAPSGERPTFVDPSKVSS